MATRLYFHEATSALSNLPTAEQSSLTTTANVDAQTVNRTMTRTIGTSQTSKSVTHAAATARTQYFTRFVSEPLDAAHTSIAANTWTYSFAARESVTTGNFPVNGTNQAVRITCYVWRPGTGKVANILDGTSAATPDEGAANTERASTCTFTGAAVASTQAGDVICFEVIIVYTPTVASCTCDYFYDGTTVTTTDGTVSNHASFIETPEDIRFSGELLNFVRSPSVDTVTVSENLLGYKPGPATVKFGTITMDATSGAHTQNFTSELGFRPKGMIFWGSASTATGAAANAVFGLGMTADAATGEMGVCCSFPDASTVSSNTTSTATDPNNCISVYDGTTILVEASANFQNNGFDIVYGTKSNTTQYKLNYFAFTAPNITNVKVITYNITAGTGNKDITSPGIPGTIAFFGGPYASANAQTGANGISFGVAMSDTKQWSSLYSADNANTTNTVRRQRSDRCYMEVNTLSGFPAIVYEASFVSFLSNGVRLNFVTTGDSGDDMMVMVVQGGDWDVGVFNQPTSTGNQIVNTTSNLNNKGVMFASFGNVADTGAIDHSRWMIGGGDGTNERCTAIGITDNVTTSIAKKDHSESKSIRLLSETSGGFTTLAEADLTSIATQGQYTINWSTADATQREVCWVSCGDTIVTGTNYTRSPTTESITISESSLDRIKSALRLPSTDTTTVSDSSLTRMLSATRVPSSDTTTITESSLTRSKTWVRVPASDSTVVADSSTTRMLSAARVPSTEVVTPSDSSLTRILSASRSPSSDSITTSENLSSGKVIVRVPSSDSVTVADSSLTRLLSALRLPSSDTITTGENLIRVLSAIRSPTTDSVTAQDSSTTQMITRVRLPSTDTTTVSDSSVSRMLSASRVPSSDTITVLDSSVTRLLSLLRIPSSDSVTTSENVTAQKSQGAQTFDRAPTAETINVIDSSLTRMLSAFRVPTSDSITVADASITRLLQLSRSPTTDTVATSDNATKAQTYTRVPTADSVIIVDSSVTRMLSALRLPSVEVISTVDSSLTRILSAVRVPSAEVVTTSESVGAQVSGRISRSVEDTVIVSENLNRMLSATRVPTADTVNLNEQLSRIVSRNRVPSSDSISVSDAALTRVVSNIRTLSETPAVLEASLTRVLSASRSLSDTTVVSELQSNISLSRRLEETVAVTEPVIQRIVTAIRATTPDIVEVNEQVFFQALHKFVFDSVSVAEQLFSERQALSGSVTYATPDEVRPLLGNIGGQRTNTQIQTAIDSAYDEINRKTGRQPPNDWKDTENDFGIVKKICRFKAALEMAVGIKDFEDREWMQKEIEEMFAIIEEGEGEGGAGTSTDIVGSSPDVTYALNPQGLIWSVRYQNLKKGGSGENDTTINPDT